MPEKKFDKTVWIKLLLIFIILADAVFIFVNSSQNAETSAGKSGKLVEIILRLTHPDFDSLTESEKTAIFSELDGKIRSAAHFIEYVPIGFCGTLLLLLCLGLSEKSLICSSGVLVFGAIYAISDEIHQGFTDGRASEVGDVILDSCGCLFGIGLAFAVYLLFRSVFRRNKKE